MCFSNVDFYARKIILSVDGRMLLFSQIVGIKLLRFFVIL